MSRAVKSSVQELSYLLPTHAQKHSGKTTTAIYRAYIGQSIYMVSITSLI